jgi:hypothetical protein
VAPLGENSVKHLSQQTVLDEVKEIIHLPAFIGEAGTDPDSALRWTPKLDQLENYVTAVASMHRNPFHSREHASHVVMSVVKLLSRIVALTLRGSGKDMASTLHDHTYGITSDP